MFNVGVIINYINIVKYGRVLSKVLFKSYYMENFNDEMVIGSIS